MGYAYDPELAAALEMMPPFSLADLPAARAQFEAIMATVPADPRIGQVDINDQVIPGPDAAPDVTVRVFTPRTQDTPLPGVLYLHSGGFVFGSVAAEQVHAATMALEADAVVVSVEYRLAPEHPYPAAVEDCYAALQWFAKHAGELGVDPQRIAVAGASAGGGLAAALALMARDHGGPALVCQLLDVPVLDDRLDTPSMTAYTDTPVWHRPNAILSWQHYLGEGRDDVPPTPRRHAPPTCPACRRPTSRPPSSIPCVTRAWHTPQRSCAPECPPRSTTSRAPATDRR